ncbi:MAG TPA: hypothetical protein VKU02_18950 [Gemmataceae bacterium]|nr:hypothetical protein [Gemmataceae bacterium]
MSMSGCKLWVEYLEDRMLLSIPDGTILVANAGKSSWGAMPIANDIVAVDPHTGAQTPVSLGTLLAQPAVICEGPAPQDFLYVADLTAGTAGAVLRIDPSDGSQTLLATGQYIDHPNALTFLNGYLYVADRGDDSGTVHNLVRIDPATGAQKLLTDGSDGGFSVPVGMVRASPLGNSLYVADEPGNVQGPDPGNLWAIDVGTGQQRLLVHGGLLDHPTDVARDSAGNLLVANTGGAADGYAGSVVRVNPQTGVQTLVTTFGPDSGIDSLTVGRDGTILVGAIAVGSNPALVIAVNPLTGAQRLVASGGFLSLVEGITIFKADGGDSVLHWIYPSPGPDPVEPADPESGPRGTPQGATPPESTREVRLSSPPSVCRAADRLEAKMAIESFFAEWAQGFASDLRRIEGTNGCAQTASLGESGGCDTSP